MDETLGLQRTTAVLFELCENKGVTVAQAMNGTAITFRRWLFDELRTIWNKILNNSNSFLLKSDSDVIFGSLENSGKFSVKSLYNGLTKNDSSTYHKRI